jgi:phosphinothricin acetyltransferase
MISVRRMSESDWPHVSRIYREGIETGEATFETVVPDWEKWNRSHVDTCRFVALEAGVIVGWAALSQVSNREVYRGVTEVSVYVAAGARGKGVGRRLLRSLIDDSESCGIWTLQATVFPENSASVRLHESFGFRIVGTRERIARQHGRWRDTILLERRSTRI